MATAASRGVPVALFTNATTGTSIPVMVPVASKNIRFHVRGAGTISAGTIILEEALDPASSGWFLIQSVTPTSNAEQVFHIPGTFSAVRARFTADATGGGNVTVTLVTD